ncbi:MAG: hypothetical protein HY741_17535 [Chloroflexi bacterium]|nr:hypothetical protein [Chloroflexota bacterium]
METGKLIQRVDGMTESDLQFRVLGAVVNNARILSLETMRLEDVLE